jgi:hypothetical protein
LYSQQVIFGGVDIYIFLRSWAVGVGCADKHLRAHHWWVFAAGIVRTASSRWPSAPVLVTKRMTTTGLWFNASGFLQVHGNVSPSILQGRPWRVVHFFYLHQQQPTGGVSRGVLLRRVSWERCPLGRSLLAAVGSWKESAGNGVVLGSVS